MLKVIDEQTNTFYGKIYGKNYTIERVVKIFSNEGQYRVRVDQTKTWKVKDLLNHLIILSVILCRKHKKKQIMY